MAVNEKENTQNQTQTQKPKRKRKWGDRKDGYLVRETDGLHALMPYILPNRADNEAVLNEVLDITKVREYLNAKNAGGVEFKYTMFHFICAAMAKTIQLRPYLNRFYCGHRLYQRYDISFAFVVKKKFVDDAAETLVIMNYDPESEVAPIDQFNYKIKQVVTKVRKEDKSSSTMDKIGFFAKIPRCILRFVIGTLRFLDYYGKMPMSLKADDPYNVTAFVSNLGSINMHASYHHLANWGTNSFFCVINTIKKRPFFKDDGSYEMKETVELGLTIDERIADGVYFAKSLKVLRYFFEHPEELDKPACHQVEIDTSIHN
ncbi:MAG: 2-oxo acid dehydrogenase subunit E2 [Eubacteriales bacterium]|jgi:hypothetical protein